MDAVKFLQERKRMHESGAIAPSVMLGNNYDPVSAVKVVEEWASVHPRKTRQSVFLEQYPNARIDRQAVIYVCPSDAYGYKVCPKNGENVHMTCSDCRRNFWLQEVQ